MATLHDPPIRIGILHSLTGATAISERPLVEAAQLAVDELNLSGGVLGCPIEAIVMDGASNPETFAGKAGELLSGKGVCALFGCWTSSSRKSVKPVVEGNNSALWYPLQYEGLEQSPNILYTGSCLNQQIEPGVRWALDNGARKCFLVGSDYVFPRTANTLIRAMMEIAGGEVLGERYLSIDSTRFTDIVDAIRCFRPDIVFNTINGAGNLSFFRELARSGISAESGPVMSFSFAETELQEVRSEAAGHLACWSYFQSLPTVENQEFLRRLRQRYGASRVASDPIVAAYVQVGLWAHVVGQCRSYEAGAVLRHACGQGLRGPSGWTEIQANNHVIKDAIVGRATAEGEFEILWRSPKPIAPKPWLGAEDYHEELTPLILRTMGQFTEAIHLNWKLDLENRKRQEAEEELRRHRDHLELLVRERTAELLAKNDLLSGEIAERKRAEEERGKLHAQLLHAQKMDSVGRLAGGIAHDFNNMLAVILGYVEIALGQLDPDDPLFADLLEVRKAAERSARLTHQLLAFARKQPASPKALNLNETQAEMIKMLRPLIGEDIDLAWLPGADLWRVNIDPNQIDQILANLCINARDAIAGVGRRISIETKNVVFDEACCAEHPGVVPGEYVQLSVTDDGCGMDGETMEKLFEPFFTTKEIGKGTGLGLSTVYGIVDQNKGFIKVSSKPGHGAVFRVHLPRHVGETECLQAKAPQETAGRGHETILLVEDEPAMLNMTKRLLEREGYRVLAAGTPGEALRLAGKHAGEIHLLVTDVVMPGMNGRDLAGKLVSRDPKLKCLLMSGYTGDGIAEGGVLEKNTPFIQKPFSLVELAAKVRGVLDST